jgi:hypothetical protein
MIPLLYKRLLQLGKVTGAVTFLFGIPYALVQYWDNQHDKRVEQSLRQFDRFNSSPFTTYREKISKVMTLKKTEIRAAAKDVTKLKATVVAIVEGNDGIETELWLIMDFFDGVAVCIVENLCDAQTAHQLLSARAQDLYETFYQYIEVQRIGSSSKFGLGLETIATAGRAPARCTWLICRWFG